MKSLPSGDSGLADTQALWRFLSNPRVSPSDLVQPLLALAHQGIAQGCDNYALVAHDWSRLNFHTHESKKDRVRMTHATDVGYELQSAVLIADRDGSPLCAPVQSLRTANGMFNSCHEAIEQAGTHLQELCKRAAWLDQQDLARPLVHIVDREADSVAHLRCLSAQGSLWLVRAKSGSKVRWGAAQCKLSEVGAQLPFEAVRQVTHKGANATQWVASTTVVLSRAAKPMALDATGKRMAPIEGAPLTARLVISQVRDSAGKLLAEWYLLSNVADNVTAATLALWYYWRWRIESYFKLLKEAGQQIEHWEQESGEAIFKRLLIASHACALAWRLMRAEGKFAQETREFLVRLSGRQMKRSTPVTASALLSGLYMLFAINETLDHYNPQQLAAFAREARNLLHPQATEDV